MKTVEKKIKEYNFESVLISLMIIVLGIIMILWPNNILNFISYLIGISLIIIGLFKIFYYLRFDGKYSIFNYDLSYGILNIILGIICFIFKNEFQSIFRIAIGLIVMYEGIISISLAHKVCYINKKIGAISILLSILMVLCGGFVVLTKGIIVRTIGYILICFAIINIIEIIIFNSNVKKIEKYISGLKLK